MRHSSTLLTSLALALAGCGDNGGTSMTEASTSTTLDPTASTSSTTATPTTGATATTDNSGSGTVSATGTTDATTQGPTTGTSDATATSTSSTGSTGSTGAVSASSTGSSSSSGGPDPVCGNGVVEQGETCDDGNAAAGDGCSNTCQLELGCAAGQTPVVVSSADERRLVPDNSMVGVTSTVNVAAVGRVAKTVVVVNSITSSFDDDLDLALVRGNLMPIELSTDNGDEGNDYLGTIFADAATRAIAGATAASAPFGGLWRPEGSLAGLNGQLATGAWALRAVDDSQFDTGMFHSWTLGLCLMPAP